MRGDYRYRPSPTVTHAVPVRVVHMHDNGTLIEVRVRAHTDEQARRQAEALVPNAALFTDRRFVRGAGA